MTPWQEPPPSDSELPPTDPDDQPSSPGEGPPAESDPEAQKAPGAEEEQPGGGPPMQASAGDEQLLDGPGIAREPVGNDNIREGRVGGVMGPAHPSMGQGQGG